jgi:formyl-CoA transferase
VISGNGDAIFRRLMHLAGRDDLAQHPELDDNAGPGRPPAGDRCGDRAWTGGHPLDEVLTALDDAGVPAGPIYTAADIVKDPHYAARGMLETHRTGSGDAKFPGIVPRLEQHPGATRWLGPDLGADTDHILDGLGLSRHQKAQLRPGGVVG